MAALRHSKLVVLHTETSRKHKFGNAPAPASDAMFIHHERKELEEVRASKKAFNKEPYRLFFHGPRSGLSVKHCVVVKVESTARKRASHGTPVCVYRSTKKTISTMVPQEWSTGRRCSLCHGKSAGSFDIVFSFLPMSTKPPTPRQRRERACGSSKFHLQHWNLNFLRALKCTRDL